MNLDFSKLSTPVSKSVGRGGTSGTTSIHAVFRCPTTPKNTWDTVGQASATMIEVKAEGLEMSHLSHHEKNKVGRFKPSIHEVVPRVPPVPPKNIEVVKNTAERHRKWGVRFPDGGAVEIVFYPPATIDEVMRQYPGASVMPCPDLINAPEMRSELMRVLRELARMEAWPDERLRQFSRLATAQPDFTLADDLRYFRERLQGGVKMESQSGL